jgi:beta-galactosidase
MNARSLRTAFALTALVIACAWPAAGATAPHTFAIGEKDFLLDGKRLQIRCGEIHFARVPREYWRDRLRRAHAMGLNTVCAYLFWNFHEWEQGKFDWAGQADAAEFCRLAQEEGLWVILRPGPYACAEWEMGGLPWWLLKDEDIKLRTRDPRFIAATRTWLAEVGRVLGPLQVNLGGPILMVQVENEYGFFGSDAAYLDDVRRAVADAGFDVPLFVCNPTDRLTRPTPPDLFKVVNFGKDPAGAFKALRAVQSSGPLMCGEFYPGWFDTWGAPHHLGSTPQYLADLDFMLSQGASFSIYMAHGGTSFGLWSGADQPFKPDTSSYDYDAPIAENGALGEKFAATRALMAKYLLPGEKLPEPPTPVPTMNVPPFALNERAPLFENLGPATKSERPQTFETLDQGHGAVLYRTVLGAGDAADLEAADVRDFGFVFLDGRQIGVMDRRAQKFRVTLPERRAPAQLDVLVYALGRVNFGAGVHDRKGLHAPVTLNAKDYVGAAELRGWQMFPLPLSDDEIAKLHWSKDGSSAPGPAFWRGHFTLEKTADTFLDLSHCGFGVVWINGHCLGRFWNIGPTQTAYVPAPWLRVGTNDVVVFDLTALQPPQLAGRDHPILDRLRPELDFSTPGAR